MKKTHTSPNGAAQNIEGNRPPIVFARKRESNRENAKKSTGPKTARGKANSRFNALKHGLCAKRLMVSSQGKLFDEDLRKLLETLQEQYGSDDIRIQLLCDAIATEHWRQGQGLRLEVKFHHEGDIHFSNQGGMALLQRYLSGSQRAQLKNLELLGKLHSQSPLTTQPAVSTVSDGATAEGKRKYSKNIGASGRTYTPRPSKSDSESAEPANSLEPSVNDDINKLA